MHTVNRLTHFTINAMHLLRALPGIVQKKKDLHDPNPVLSLILLIGKKKINKISIKLIKKSKLF